MPLIAQSSTTGYFINNINNYVIADRFLKRNRNEQSGWKPEKVIAPICTCAHIIAQTVVCLLHNFSFEITDL